MNGLERAYAKYLDTLKGAEVIQAWWWDAISLRLADAENTHYRPDFLVLRADGSLELHDTKGHMEDDAWVKLKVVAAYFPFPMFVVRRKKGSKGEWTWEEVGAPPSQKKKNLQAEATSAVAARLQLPAGLSWPK